MLLRNCKSFMLSWQRLGLSGAVNLQKAKSFENCDTED